VTALKAAVFALLLANIVYFLWARSVFEPARHADDGQVRLPSLRLAAEVPGLSAAPADAAPAGAMKGPELLRHVERCISIGPFHDMPEAARAASTLREGGYVPHQRATEGEYLSGVWVFLAKPSSQPATDSLLSKLRAAGIDDALEMPGPKEGEVLSLGLYSEQAKADGRIAALKAIGLHPFVTDRKRSGNVYWLDIALKPTDGMLRPADLHTEAGHIMRLEVIGCPAQKD
jgi:hypothetical protein